MSNSNTIEITGQKTIVKLCKFGAEHGMEGSSFTEILEKLFSKHQEIKSLVDLAGEWITSYQDRVQPWLLECFGPMIAGDREERNHRFLEEALELVQSTGCTASEAHQLVDYVFGRPVGEPVQEVGGVMVTLAALCHANNLNMHQAGETELTRINQPDMVLKIRAKQAAKPKHSPLPEQTQIPITDQPLKTYVIKWQRDVSHEFNLGNVFKSATESGEGQVKGTTFADAVNNFKKQVPDGEITFIQLEESIQEHCDESDLSNDPNHQHEYEEWHQHNVDQNQLDYRKKTPGLMQALGDDTPHTYYSRDCKSCGHTELSERVELYAPNPRLQGQNHD